MISKIWLKTGKIIVLLLYACGIQGQNFDEMVYRLIDESVPLIQPENLNEALNTKSILVILDAREKEEYQVSHLKNAIWVGYKDFEMASINIPKDMQVVVYCSVGYRSENIGVKLQDAGYKNVRNLYGGIFKWKNDGYDVYDNTDNPTNKVHAYNESWGKWLVNGERVYDQ